MKTVLVTGGTGFLGKHVALRLLAREELNLRIGSRKAKVSENPRVQYVKTDYNDPASLAQAVEGVHAVIHLAAAVAANTYHEFEAANITATRNLVAACAQSQTLETFILASSLAAAGPSATPRTEDLPETPVSNYGKTKLAAERELAALPEKVNRVVLRPAIVYGKNDTGIGELVEWVERGIMINSAPSGTQYSFIYVEDAAECFLMAMDRAAEMNGKKYFICERDSYTWNYFIKEIAKTMGKPAPLMVRLPAALVKLAGLLYGFTTKMMGIKPVFNLDKAREATVGGWAASPALWMKDSGQKEWTKLPEGIRQIFY
ncbi:MAG: NAD(P)-dependent oxidoreductase [Elusimicrobiaceae bacterium]